MRSREEDATLRNGHVPFSQNTTVLTEEQKIIKDKFFGSGKAASRRSMIYIVTTTSNGATSPSVLSQCAGKHARS